VAFSAVVLQRRCSIAAALLPEKRLKNVSTDFFKKNQQ
jgi:hypothetical protein